MNEIPKCNDYGTQCHQCYNFACKYNKNPDTENNVQEYRCNGSMKCSDCTAGWCIMNRNPEYADKHSHRGMALVRDLLFSNQMRHATSEEVKAVQEAWEDYTKENEEEIDIPLSDEKDL